MIVKTVLGEVDEKSLGIIAPHEHILLNAWSVILSKDKDIMPEIKEVTRKNLFNQRVSISNLGKLKINPLAVLDNVILSDVDLAIEEILEFKKFGGDTIVDQTNENMGRDPISLKNISRATELNIITATGHYIEANQPDYVAKKREIELAQIMVKEIGEGIDDTGIRAGVIGEIGVSKGILPNEKKVLRASAIAQKETGVALSVHTWPFGTDGIEVLNILEKAGANLEKVIICHVDGQINLKYCKELLSRGVFIEFDHFGKEYREISDGKLFIIPNDLERIELIYKLINLNEDYINKILLSTDRCLKMELVKYGGFGYAHILKNIIPYMRMYDFSEEQIDTLISKNPKNAISIRK